ncbi:WhiB family transcriptional regulator [Streptomyces sp. NPDC002701]|uniref:WhiB family transcriptional regulator n=1 Tax=Streptomyces sp. NPDC002701 TaxID=3364661 RepID=UPI0036949E08
MPGDGPYVPVTRTRPAARTSLASGAWLSYVRDRSRGRPRSGRRPGARSERSPGGGGSRRGRRWRRPEQGVGVGRPVPERGSELWFSDRTRAIARALCQSCEVLAECRAAVLRREDALPECDRGGIVAGLTGPQRHALDRRLKRPPAPPPAPPSPTGPAARLPVYPSSSRLRYALRVPAARPQG